MGFPGALLCSLALTLTWLSHGGAAQPTTDASELAALKIVASSLKIPTNWWDFSVDPCSGLNGWNKTENANSFIDSPTTGIRCNCDNTTCHVITIVVVSVNVDGTIPPEIGSFTSLNDLNLAQNVITGTLPEEIGNLTNLQYLTVGINKLSGPFPKSFGKLTKLVSIGFGSNSFTGTLPKEIGNLQSLRKIYMDFCGLGGPLPDEFGNLTKLETLWMAGNSFNGSIPDSMGKLVNLQDMKMHGNYFQGQIPASFGNLRNLKTLDLGDISSGGIIPATLNQLTGITKLILRNCDLSGPIPDLGNLSTLLHLDLSFNNLTGTVPASLWSFPSLQNLLLGSNRLTGQLPATVTSSLIRLDVSYNELTGALPSWLSRLQQSSVVWNQFNLVSDSVTNCLQARANCTTLASGRNIRFAVNCGGPRVTTSTGTVYSEDSRVFTMGTYFSGNQDWALSATGYSDGFVKAIENTTVPVLRTVDPIIYQTARSAPSSLRYYGLGLRNGLYTLELNFAEIKLDNSTSWVGITRRLFDVHLQGSPVPVLREFNIQNEAGGSSRALIKQFKNVSITNNFLEIHFQWKGKGTCCYGPLISAIRLTPEFDTTGLEPVIGKKSSKTGLAAGIAVGAFVLVLVVLAALYVLRKRRQRYESAKEFMNMEGKPDLYSYSDLKTATRGFAEDNKLGQGGFGAVYKGSLPNGTVVAVKQLAAKSQQGSQEFLNEVTIISAVQHRNLVKLYGCCVEADHRLLVYEFLENNSLHHVLLSSKSDKYHLDWQTRFNICVGVARGIAYLHEDSKAKIVHRDIKAANVLLDGNMNAKLADFGLAKLFQDHETHVSTRVAGTFGYLAPEYAMRGQLTEKADVYSFGVLALEVVSGRNNLDTSLPGDMVYLMEWAWSLYENGSLLDLVDARIADSFSAEEVVRVIQVALLCTQTVATSRPAMSHVVAMLVGTAPVDVSSLRAGYFSLLKDAAPGFFSAARDAKKVSADQVSSTTSSSSQAFTSSSAAPSSAVPSERSVASGR